MTGWRDRCARAACRVNSVDFSDRVPGQLECECGETWHVGERALRHIIAECRDPMNLDADGETEAQMHLDAMLYRRAFVQAGRTPPRVDLQTGAVVQEDRRPGGRRRRKP